MKNDYLIIGADYDDDYLAHYGVLGMKWHHHRASVYKRKAARANENAKGEREYRKEFDKDMKRRMNKNDPKDVLTWQNTRREEHDASKFNEQVYRDRAKKYNKKAQQHLEKNRANVDKYRNIAKTESETIAKMYKDKGYKTYTDSNYGVNDGYNIAWTERGRVAAKKVKKYSKYI